MFNSNRKVVVIPAIPPMDHQLKFWQAADKGIRRFILSWPRRAGKDITACSYLVREALKVKGTYWILGPTKTQAVGIYWNTKTSIKHLDAYTQNPVESYGSILDICCPESIRQKTNITDKAITLHNGSVIKIGGTADESFVGQTGQGFIITEYSLDGHSDYMLALLNPILSQSGGWLIVNGTQRSDTNRLYAMINDTKNNSMWYVSYLSMADLEEYCWVSPIDPKTGEREFNINPHLLNTTHRLRGTPIENVQHAVDSEPHRKSWYMREYLNIPTSLEEGSYYDEALAYSEVADDIVHDVSKVVYTAWDLGLRDDTAIVFFQLDDDNNPTIIDYFQDSGHGIGFYIDHLKTLPYRFGAHIVPNDAGRRSMQLGIDLVEFARQAFDFYMVRLNRTMSLKSDIELVRSIIPKTKFNRQKSELLLKHLYSYHEDENTGKPQAKNDHGADSFRYMCVAIQAGLCVPMLSNRRYLEMPIYAETMEETWNNHYNSMGLAQYAE